MGVPLIYLGMPVSGTYADARACKAFYASTSRDYQFRRAVLHSSLLAHGFNQLWADALNRRADYFVMLHSDVIPQDGWLDILVDEIVRSGADVVSVVVPIKDERGLTSCGIGDPANVWQPLRRFTMRELARLPMTFSSADAGFPDCPLLVNTGCWIADLKGLWATEVVFTVNDRIVRRDDRWVAESEPEDWNLSRLLHRFGCKVLATQKVQVWHTGGMDWNNQRVDGGIERDHLATTELTIKPRRHGESNGQVYETPTGQELVFVHVPKTGGLAIRERVGRIAGELPTMNHRSLASHYARFGKRRMDAALKFAVIRHPCDRLLSAWSYLQQQTPQHPFWEQDTAERDWMKSIGGGDFRSFVMALTPEAVATQVHFTPQLSWLTNDDGQFGLDEVLRFERLADDWRGFAEQIAAPLDLPVIGMSYHEPWQDVFDAEMLDRVCKVYAVDFTELKDGDLQGQAK